MLWKECNQMDEKIKFVTDVSGIDHSDKPQHDILEILS